MFVLWLLSRGSLAYLLSTGRSFPSSSLFFLSRSVSSTFTTKFIGSGSTISIIGAIKVGGFGITGWVFLVFIGTSSDGCKSRFSSRLEGSISDRSISYLDCTTGELLDDFADNYSRDFGNEFTDSCYLIDIIWDDYLAAKGLYSSSCFNYSGFSNSSGYTGSDVGSSTT